ncbi:AbrB family transcriptional regulator [Macrococcus animalis]|uniref:AbrB family transcriptional regulator n=1 Tax=Macrococcus animalis TaxID=3395467 RepID=UPI0039BEA515
MNYIILFVVSIIFGYLLDIVGLILPWLFGPILAALVLKKYTELEYQWPKWIGDIGLYILGAQIGVSFTKEILGDIVRDFWSVVFLSVMIILSAVAISFLFKKIVGCTTETALLASIPGALNQMIVMAEENNRANILVVTLAQTSRLLFVIMIVPFISSITSEEHTFYKLNKAKDISEILNFQQILLIIVMIAISIYFLKMIHFPVPDMLGPTFAILTWNLITGMNFTIPMPLINFAQILFGVRIGLQMYDLSSQINRRLFIGIFVQNVLLILCAIGLSILLNVVTHHNFNDIFLSAAPGGMAQIIIVALETGANVAMISSYHIFRIFLILLAVAPIMAWYLNHRTKSLVK